MSKSSHQGREACVKSLRKKNEECRMENEEYEETEK